MVRETTHGTTPTTPRMRTMRITGETLTFTPTYVDSAEIRGDRMIVDPGEVMQASSGGTNGELAYPVDLSPASEKFMSVFEATWSNTPQADNDGTADSVITNVATTNEVLTATLSATIVAGHLARFTGFGVATNNGVFKCTTGSSTVPRFVGAGLTDEAAPPAAARVKVVGFQGASGDITASSTGLASTILDFTTLGLAVGQMVKIGGTATGDKFATAALNDWCRVSAIAAHALTLDNRPSGWTTDTGTGQTIKVWFGDEIKNGTTPNSVTIEEAFLGQSSPTYIVHTGMQANTYGLTIANRRIIAEAVNWSGMGGSESTTPLDASPDAATTGRVISGNANVGRISEAGSPLASPNWANEVTININNNLRPIEAVDSISPQGINDGECTVTGRLTTYFGNDTLLAKLYAATASSIISRVQRDSQALVFQIPRGIFRAGEPQVSAKNTDVFLPLDYSASYDAATGAHIILDRLEYYE
jgi:hypothetical protein